MINKTGLLFALIASITWGIVYNIDQKILIKSSPLTMFFVGSIINIIVIFPLYFFYKDSLKDLISIDKNQFILIFIGQILVIIAGLAILYAVKYLDAPVASSLEISYPLFVVFFYYLIFNGTTLSTNFWIGSALIFVGSLFIIK